MQARDFSRGLLTIGLIIRCGRSIVCHGTVIGSEIIAAQSAGRVSGNGKAHLAAHVGKARGKARSREISCRKSIRDRDFRKTRASMHHAGEIRDIFGVKAAEIKAFKSCASLEHAVHCYFLVPLLGCCFYYL